MALSRVANLKRYAGRAVDGHHIKVASVPADEGFWIDAGGGDRIWVQMHLPNESNVHVRPGDVIDFHGKVVANGPNFVHRIGLAAGEGAARLKRNGFHIAVRHVTKES